MTSLRVGGSANGGQGLGAAGWSVFQLGVEVARVVVCPEPG